MLVVRVLRVLLLVSFRIVHVNVNNSVNRNLKCLSARSSLSFYFAVPFVFSLFLIVFYLCFDCSCITIILFLFSFFAFFSSSSSASSSAHLSVLWRIITILLWYLGFAKLLCHVKLQFQCSSFLRVSYFRTLFYIIMVIHMNLLGLSSWIDLIV